MEEKKENFTLVCNDWCIDWPTTNDVVINDNDYLGYEIQKRFGPTWWVIGIKKNVKYDLRQEQFGEVSKSELLRFMRWAGTRIVSFNCIASNMGLITDLKEILSEI